MDALIGVGLTLAIVAGLAGWGLLAGWVAVRYFPRRIVLEGTSLSDSVVGDQALQAAARGYEDGRTKERGRNRADLERTAKERDLMREALYQTKERYAAAQERLTALETARERDLAAERERCAQAAETSGAADRRDRDLLDRAADRIRALGPADALAEILAAERERCARVADKDRWGLDRTSPTAEGIAAEIRALK